jgi:hypothetical protein
VNKRIAAFCFSLLILTTAFYFGSCTRIHDSTELGDELIPAVDNVNTFDTVVSVLSYNDSFTIGNADRLLNDSTRMAKSAIHYVGRINNDPLFGTTDAQLFFELKPPTFKYYFENFSSDSLFIDSVVLVLDYQETFGDTDALQTVNVYELANTSSNLFKTDSSYLLRVKSFTEGNLLGTKTFAPSILNDSIKAYKDTTKNQLRIRLDDAFGTRLLLYDSSATSAYAGDSAFRSKFKGFAVTSSGGNALMGFSLAGANTKLALYYHYYNKLPNIDTAVRYFSFNAATCGNANYIKRGYSGFPIATALSGGTTTPDDLLYIQATPGTFARIKMPDLSTVTNRVVHRAELIVEQISHPLSDPKFFNPEMLFLDVLDTALKDYRYMPYDFTIDQSGSPNLTGFGASGKATTDAGGNPIQVWKFNMTRYVQNVLTKKEPVHDLRLFAPYIVDDTYKPSLSSVGGVYFIGVNSSVARGRVRVAGGNFADPTKKLRLRIVYSKI